MTAQQIQLIDDILLALSVEGEEFDLSTIYGVSFSPKAGFELSSVESILVNRGLIVFKPHGDHSRHHSLTKLAKDIVADGGWELHFKKQEEFKREFEDDRKIMRKINDNSLKMHKIQKRSLIVSGFTGVAAIIVSTLQYLDSNGLEHDLFHVREQLEVTTQRTKSLTKELDSLRTHFGAHAPLDSSFSYNDSNKFNSQVPYKSAGRQPQ